MTKTQIKAVNMTRTIRDKHAAALQNVTPAERIAFYREKARQMRTVASEQETERKVA